MQFSYTRVNEYIRQLKLCLKRINEIKAEYSTQIKKVKGGSIWKGPAATGFTEKGDITIKGLNELEISLKNSIIYLETWSENYKDLENKIQSAIAKIL